MKDKKLDQYYDILKMIEAVRENTRFLMRKIALNKKVSKIERVSIETEVQAFLDKLKAV